MDLVLSLETLATGESREIQSDLEISLLFKETLHQETQENWIKLLLIALLRMQLAPGG